VSYILILSISDSVWNEKKSEVNDCKISRDYFALNFLLNVVLMCFSIPRYLKYAIFPNGLLAVLCCDLVPHTLMGHKYKSI
jgi:hypothetical protein